MTTSPCFFFFNDTATTEIYTLSLHDALPISLVRVVLPLSLPGLVTAVIFAFIAAWNEYIVALTLMTAPERKPRSEEHTSELQSQSNLVCRLLLEKKNNIRKNTDFRHSVYQFA